MPFLLYALPLAALLITRATGALEPVTVAFFTQLLALISSLVLAIANARRHRADRLG